MPYPSLYSTPMQHILLLQEDPPSSDASPESSSSQSSTPSPSVSWRLNERLRTTQAALVLCLNLGVPPPGIPSPPPACVRQAWIYPTVEPSANSLQHILTTLKSYYDQYQKTRIKNIPDPVHNDLKRICVALRKAAKSDRVLFHYNGHGVPKLMPEGDLWCFNNTYTQYLPLNLYDLHASLGSPNLFLLDCHGAGAAYEQFIELQQNLHHQHALKHPTSTTPPAFRSSVMLAAVSADELLPMQPPLPADLFTSCLLTPIRTALLWFATTKSPTLAVPPHMLDRIPGALNSRDTPLGELNWILTAVTDTIAYQVLPQQLFKSLYRSDILLSALFRNYLLADRIFRSFGKHPKTYPELPPTHDHPLWHNFDIAMEQLLFQLPALLGSLGLREERPTSSVDPKMTPSLPQQPSFVTMPYASMPRDGVATFQYKPSTFFLDQMTAFQVWLDMGSQHRSPPLQLPIMLQILLSIRYRPRAVPLLMRYMQLGEEAVKNLLAVGLFPYIMRLLKTKGPYHEMKHCIFMWGKMMATDSSCKNDLVKEDCDGIFVQFLMGEVKNVPRNPEPVFVAMGLFVLSVVAQKYADRCRNQRVMDACFYHLANKHPFARRWAALCLLQVIINSKKQTRRPTHWKVLQATPVVDRLVESALNDSAPDVRAAAIAALAAVMIGVLQQVPFKPDPQSPPPSQPPRPSCDDSSSPRPSRSEASVEKTSTVTESPTGLPTLAQGHAYASSPVYISPFYLHPALISTSEENTPSPVPAAPPPLQSRAVPSETSNVGDETAPFPEADFLDAPVDPVTFEEREAVIRIGKPLSTTVRNESSVLVRRELALAIAAAAIERPERFLRAAYTADVIGFTEEDEAGVFMSDVDECEMIYRNLWRALTDLAFDPHPVVAALARRSYDVVYEQVSRIAHERSMLKKHSPIHSDPFASASSLDSKVGDALSASSSSPEPSAMLASKGAPSTNIINSDSVQSWPGNKSTFSQPSVRESLVPQLPVGGGALPGVPLPKVSQVPSRIGTIRPGSFPDKVSPLNQNKPRKIHVRGGSASFDLDAASRLALTQLNVGIPRVNSLTMMQLPKQSRIPRPVSAQHNLSLNKVEIDSFAQERRRSAGSAYGSALGKGVGNLMRSFSQQLNLNVRKTTTRPSSAGISQGPHNNKDERTRGNMKSPPRPPMRSYSYQVLSAATALSQEKSPRFGVGLHGKQKPQTNEHASRYVPSGGDAALSLYEWSCACIHEVQYDGTSAEFTHPEEPMARYAVLTHKITTADSETPLEEMMRTYATLPERRPFLRSGSMGPEEKEDWSEFASAGQLAVHNMSAGGGAITAVAFLPRDSGIADDQLIAVGDSNGSVGVYDIKSGHCQGSFGVPAPAGLDENGINAILCLNPPSPDIDKIKATPNSRSALILAGAYDGRVAVFKSNHLGRNYQIMSTFQASGDALGGRSGNNMQRIADDNAVGLGEFGYRSMLEVENTIRNRGNGLIMDFAAANSLLAVGGCDGEIVRVWDLNREHCLWKGKGTRRGVLPTSISFSRLNSSILYIGCSDGRVNMVDTRIRNPSCMTEVASTNHPVICVGGSVIDGAEALVCGNMGGKVGVLWPSNDVQGETCEELFEDMMCSMTLHPSGLFAACASNTDAGGRIKILSPRRFGFGKVRDYELEARVSCAGFQHETGLLAAGCSDGNVISFGRPEHVSVWGGL